MLSTPIARLRLIGLIESLSWFVLAFIAMPVKYIAALGADETLVKIVGPIHGVLWCLYLLALFLATRSPGLPKPLVRMTLLCTLLTFPIPLLMLDPKLKAHEAALADGPGPDQPPADPPATPAPSDP